MGINAKKGFAKGNRASNVQNRIWRDLMQLHTINKKKPTKKLMGRERSH
jgi:hypothetical protein